jgi:four helix bundle protein
MEGWKDGRMEEWKIGQYLLAFHPSILPAFHPTFQSSNLPIFHPSAKKGARYVTQLQPRGLRDLRAYQLAKQLAHLVYETTSSFPNGEYRLVGQMRGAAVSVFGNITEGYGRNAVGDYIRFCEIARGSLSELGSYVEFCRERKMLNPADGTRMLDLYNHTWNTLGALIRSLKEKKLDGSWDRTYQAVKEEQELYDV